jgi:alginate O-acetyltransferase complex protein AlgI
MLFNSVQYLIFLPIVVGIFWLLKKPWRPTFLLLASYYFYMSWFAPYCLLLAGLTVSNYFFGLALTRLSVGTSRRKLVFLLGLCINLGCLAFFKYANFLLELVSPMFRQLASFGLPTITTNHLNILLPLAISFFVFEFVHYLGDIYGGTEPIRNPIRFALFAAFFPSQIAGPIKRYEQFDEQFDEQFSGAGKFSPALFWRGITLILQGLFKKVALGDNLVPIVDKGFGSIQYLAPCDAWVTALAFAFQIYYDFSGYTDIGRGSAMLLGIALPENFEKPYLSTSLVDFWRRWHMTLSFWLRDYVYKPLGGSRQGALMQNRNLLITMLLGGLWHGASWHFVIWGAFHGIGLVVNHGWNKLTASIRDGGKLGSFSNSGLVSELGLLSKLIGISCTFFFVIIGWVLFRADDFQSACAMYRHMFVACTPSLEPGFLWTTVTTSTLPTVTLVYCIFLFWCAFLKKSVLGSIDSIDSIRTTDNSRTTGNVFSARLLPRLFRPTPIVRTAAYAGFALLILCLASKRAAPFIYFQF